MASAGSAGGLGRSAGESAAVEVGPEGFRRTEVADLFVGADQQRGRHRHLQARRAGQRGDRPAGEGVVNAPIVRVASVVLDNRRATEWVADLEEARVVRMLGPTEFVEYDRVGTPPIIMLDRDFVCRGKVEVDLPPRR